MTTTRRNPLHVKRGGICGGELDEGTDHVVVAISDIEMGAGGSTDDFPQTAFLGELLLAYNEPPFDAIAVTVVFNGDALDLLKTSLNKAYPTRITSAIAVAKLDRILAAHERFFDQLGEFVRHEGAPRRIVFVVGNHDQDLMFPAVKARLRKRIGSSAVEFPGHSYTVDDVLLEHGNQRDPLFATDLERPFLELDGQTVLNIPWGTVALLEVALPLHQTLHALDRLRPRKLVLEQLPDVRELLLQSYWHYWTRDYWRELLSTDPLHRISWTMIKEIVYRLRTGDPNLPETDVRDVLQRETPHRTFIVGHRHNAGFWSQEDRRVIQTGAFRNEYLLDLAGGDHVLLPKVYAEVHLQQGRTKRAHLVEVEAPPPPTPVVPRDITDVLPEVQRLLRDLREQSER